MEFIPLEKYEKSKIKKKKRGVVKENLEDSKQSGQNETDVDVLPEKSSKVKRIEKKPPNKAEGLKKVKNKYKEVIAQKNEKKIQLRKEKKKKEVESKKKSELSNSLKNKKLSDSLKNKNKKLKEVSNVEENEEAQIQKRKRLDDKKKNRLFLKLKKKIKNESEIKELHPDIRQVIFPRKKNSRWCWAVFVSEERADEALKQLIKNKEILASKPNPHEMVEKKREKKLVEIQRRKDARKKLQEMWI